MNYIFEKEFTVVLADRSLNKKGVLVNTTDTKYKKSLNSANEFYFNVYKTLDGHDELLWDSVLPNCIIYVPELDEFFESSLQINQTNSIIKQATCTSLCESELSQVNLYDIEINTSSDILREDYVITTFYNPNDSKGSLLDRLLYKAPHYSIGHVDETLYKIQRTFSFSSTTLLDALNEVADEIGILFQYDTTTRTINAYDLYNICQECGHRHKDNVHVCEKCGSIKIKQGYGKNTNIYVSTENLTDSITLTDNYDSLKNCFRIKGGDELMTATLMNINPTSSQYIYNFGDTVLDMPQRLKDKIKAYEDMYDTAMYDKTYTFTEKDLLSQYNKLIQKYNGSDYGSYQYDDDNKRVLMNNSYAEIKDFTGYSKLSEYYYDNIDFKSYLQSALLPTVELEDVPIDEEVKRFKSSGISKISLSSVTKSTSKQTVELSIKNYAKFVLDIGFSVDVSTESWAYQGVDDGYDYGIWTGTFIITKTSTTEEQKITDISVVVNNNYEEFLNQKILENLKDDYTVGSIYDVLVIPKNQDDLFKSSLKHYCLARLKSFEDAFQAALDILIEADQATLGASFYETSYLFYYNRLKFIGDEYALRNQEIEIVSEMTNLLEVKKQQIADECNLEKYMGTADWKVLRSYIKEQEYENSNYISDGLTNSELIKQAQQLYDKASLEIKKASELVYTISTTLDNLLVIEAFEPLRDSFELGNWINIRIDEEVLQFRLISATITPSSASSIEVEFSTSTKSDSILSDIANILDSANSMSKSYSYVTTQATKGEEANQIVNDWVQNGLDLTKLKILNSNRNNSVTYDSNGLWVRNINSITGLYDPEQLKFVNSTIAFTTDNWQSVSTALGKIIYIDPFTGEEKTRYGVNAEALVGKFILGENLGIYNDKNTLRVDENGFVMNAITNTGEAIRKMFDLQVNGNSVMSLDTGGNFKLSPTVGFGDTTLEDFINQNDEGIITKINELQVGGRNYFIIQTSTDGYRFDGNGVLYKSANNMVSDYIEIGDNQQVTFTVYKKYAAGNDEYFLMCFWDTNKKFISRPFMEVATTTKNKTSWTIDVPSNADYLRVAIPSSLKNYVKVEFGNKSTDYTVAPEDIDYKFVEVNKKYSELELSNEQFRLAYAQFTGSVDQKFNGEVTTELSKSIAQVKQDFDGFASTVKTTYTTKREFNKLEIGGRNLLKGSHKTAQNYTYPTSNYKDTWNVATTEKLNGDTYTLSFWAKSTVNGDKIRVHFFSPSNITKVIGSQGQNGTATDGLCDFKLSTTLTKYWVTYTIPKGGNSTRAVIIARMFSGSGTGTVSIQWEKVEEGNKATDWSPAPEDYDENVNEKLKSYTTTKELDVKFSTNNESILSNVSSNYVSTTTYNTGVNKIEERLKSAEQKITDEAIISTVSGTYTTKTEFDNLAIGSRNLYYLKDFSKYTRARISSYSITNGEITLVCSGTDMYIGEVIQSAGKAWSNLNGPLMYVEGAKYVTLNVSNSLFNKNYYNFYDKNKNSLATFSAFGSNKKTIAVPSNAVYMSVRIGHNTSTSGTTYKLRVKVEIGNKTTDWTPAIEDVDASIDNVSSTFQTKIEQTDKKIDLKVSKDNVISSINQTAETIKINASKIELTGQVSFSMFDSNTQTTITNSSSNASSALTKVNGLETRANNGEFNGTSTVIANVKASYDQTSINDYATYGRSVNWNLSAETEAKVNDIVHLCILNTTKNAYCFIVGKVTKVNSSTYITVTSYGLLDKGSTGSTGLKALQPTRNWNGTFTTIGQTSTANTPDFNRTPIVGDTFTNIDGSSNVGTWQVTAISGTVVTIKLLSYVSSKGATGAKGKGVSKIVTQYYLSTSNTSQAGGSWSETIPTWSSGKYYWTRDYITWSDSTTTYTTAVLDNALTSANSNATSAKSTADTVNKTVTDNKANWDLGKTAYNWTNTNGTNMVNLRNMVTQWTNGAVSSSTKIRGGWIETNTITAEKLALGDFTNLITIVPSIPETFKNIPCCNLTQTIDDLGNYCVMGAASDNYLMFCDYTPFQFSVGDELYFTGTIPNWGQIDIGVNLYVWLYDANKTYVGSYAGQQWTLKKTTWNNCSGSVKIGTLPSKKPYYYLVGIAKNDQTTVSIGLSSKAFCGRKYSGQLIVDGSITAAKISAGAITAEKLAVDAIKSRNYVKDTAGSYLNLSTGSFDSKYLKWDSTGKITATSGTIGGLTINKDSLSFSGKGKMFMSANIEGTTKFSFNTLDSGGFNTKILDWSFIDGKGNVYSSGYITPAYVVSQHLKGDFINANKILYAGDSTQAGQILLYSGNSSFSSLSYDSTNLKISTPVKATSFEATSESYFTKSGVAYKDPASGYNAAIKANGSIIISSNEGYYIGTNHLKITADSGDSYRVRISSNKGNSGGGIHLCCDYGVNVVNYDNNTFTLIRASAFNVSSLLEYKTNIKPLENPFDIIQAGDIYTYNLKQDIKNGMATDCYGFVIGDGYKVPSNVLSYDKKTIDQYAMSGILWGATKELIKRSYSHDDKIRELETENNKLKQQITTLEDKLNAFISSDFSIKTIK